MVRPHSQSPTDSRDEVNTKVSEPDCYQDGRSCTPKVSTGPVDRPSHVSPVPLPTSDRILGVGSSSFVVKMKNNHFGVRELGVD